MQTFQRNRNTGGKLGEKPASGEGIPSSTNSRISRQRVSCTSPSAPAPPTMTCRADAALSVMETSACRLAAVIPAHNEEQRIGKVIETLLSIPDIDTIVVVNDGSSDNTAKVARSYCPAITFVDLKQNQGKGGAMLHGVRAASGADVVLFLDADLVGLTCDHVRSLAAPVISGDADMSVGQFRGGRGLTDLAQLLMPYISGQRAIRRNLFLEVPDLDRVGYGIEMAITTYVKSRRGSVRMVTMRGVTHPMKEEKLGFVKGAKARLRMYAQMVKFFALHATVASRKRR